MKTLSREGIQRMIDGQGASSGGGGGIQSLAGYATQAWTEENYLSKPYFNQLFTIHTQITTSVVDDQGEPVGDPVISYGTLAPNALPGTTETTDEETGYVTTVATVITSIEAKFGFWSQSFISALGQGSGGGGGGGATTLSDLLDVEFSGTPSDGQVLKYNGTTHKWYNGNDEGLTSLPWSSITGKPTTLSGYGITDAYTKTEADGRYLKLSGGTMSNTNVVTNMNADTVDGFHASGLLQEMTFNSGVLGIKIGNTTMSAKMFEAHHRNGSNGGTDGWLKMVTIDVSQVSYKNQPFRFFITQRNKKGALLTLLLNNGMPVAETNPFDYVIVAFSYQGEITKAIVTTDSANVFSIWIQKSEAWDNVAMSLINYDIVYMNGAIVSYQDGFQTSEPSGTEAVMDTLTWSQIANKPTTLSGYGITDAYISSGTIYLGGNSITPLTSFTETDPTVPAWAKASTKPSYAFSELTGSVAFSQLPTMYWADVAVSSSSNNNTSPQFGNLRLRPGSGNYGSYLRFGDGDFAYLAELSDDQLTYRAGSHTFNVSSNEAVQINNSGLRIGGSSGVVLSWDSTNNALKVQKADGTAANFYATGGVSALGLSGGSGGSIGNLRVTGTLNIGSSYASLYCNSNNYLHVDAPRIYFDSTLYMGSNNIRTESGDIYTEEGNIYLGGGRLYLDSSRYIYLDGTTLKFYDGSTAKTIYTY